MTEPNRPTRRVDPARQPEIVRRFAARLRRLRLERGLTQVELARRAKVAQSYVGRLESARSAPGIDLVERLADALGVAPEELTAGGDGPEAGPVLRARARELTEKLVSEAGEDTLQMLNPLLARLIEGEKRGG